MIFKGPNFDLILYRTIPFCRNLNIFAEVQHGSFLSKILFNSKGSHHYITFTLVIKIAPTKN
jgi:hypothetical protein